MAYIKECMSDDLKFEFPSTIAISGPSNCGKTYWVYKFLKNIRKMGKSTSEIPTIILYCYSIDQPMFEEIRRYDDHIIFYQGVPDENYISEMSKGKAMLIILDDLDDELLDNKDVLKLFTQGSHHKKLTIIFIMHNIFQKGKYARTIALNVKYMILFANPRDNLQISYLGRQIFPGTNRLREVFEDATKTQEWGYLVIDLQPKTENDYRLRTNIFPSDIDDTGVIIYVSK